MATKTSGKTCCPTDDVWSAPESGTGRDNTSGNLPAHPQERGAPSASQTSSQGKAGCNQGKDDPCFAGEER